MLRSALALLLLPCFAVPILGQQKPDPNQENPQKEETGEIEDGKVSEKDREAAANQPRSARGMCHFVTACVPKRVPPGGSGTIVVVMVMEGDSVLLTPPPVTFDYPEQQGSIRMGQPQFRPARTATLATAFQGNPVYDNTAMIDIPFTVATNTVFGKTNAWVNLTFDLHQGRTGQPIGRFTDRATCDIEIGIPEQPVSATQLGGEVGATGGSVARANSQPASQPSAAGETPPAVAGKEGAGAPGEANGQILGEVQPPPAPRDPTPAPMPSGEPVDGGPAVVPGDGGTLWLMVAGGFLLVAAVALLATRRR